VQTSGRDRSNVQIEHSFCGTSAVQSSGIQ
jgi:hypothetical protein